ncbi:polysaccharide lyase family 8 super-sandwich domain-containing protein [Kribbella sp. NPDC051770]|uniref:polysaccharide lyase family 8 super-sandwich domain-containing protein n=1 Tax=Kribbella sp. NPDC051770 TaxID=3155413 RepID=UPI00343DD3AD
MELSRRRLLSFVPAATLLTAVHPAVASAADPVVAGEAADAGPEQLLTNLAGIFTGTAESNARPAVAAKLAAMDQTARTWLSAMDRAGATEAFAGLPLGTSDPNLSASYQHLYEIALAVRRPGPASELQGNAAIRARVLEKLTWLHANYYGDQAKGYYGNWFTWEIGISGFAGKTLALLDAPQDLVTTYVASMDAYLRNGTNGDVNLDSRFHTGANLADITTNRIVQGALLGDDARIRKALQDQFTVFATIDPYDLRHGVTDGYYADGSFIQHSSVAYTGSYGKGLLSRVVQTVKLLDGTAYATSGDLVKVVQGWVETGFAPLIFEGWMMEIVKGRAVSRPGTGYDDVAVVIEAVVDLADYASAADAARLRSYVKFTARPTLNPNSFVSPVSVGRFAEIVADSSIVAADLNPAASSVAFNAMDKTVHRRPGYAFALARSSERISKYEYMSGENLLPWFQGDGAYYLYLSGQDQTQAYGVDYFTTVSPYGLAGVTAPVEMRQSVPALYGTAYYDNPTHPLNFTASSESQNTYVYFPVGTNRHSGGATLDALGAVGWVQSDDYAYAHRAELPDDFVTYRNASATKSWFLLDDQIVVLAAGVGDASRAATTTVDARPSVVPAAVEGVLRNGRRWTGPGVADLRWLHYSNGTQSVGYYFHGSLRTRVAQDQITRSRRVIRTSNPDTAVTRNVFSLTLDHAAGELTSHAYSLLPNATRTQLAGHRPVRILTNTRRAQAIQSGTLTAANTFASGPHLLPGLILDGPTSVLTRSHGRQLTVAVSDPTFTRTTIPVLVPGRWLTLTTPNPAVRLTHTLLGTRLTFTTHHLHGATVRADLR